MPASTSEARRKAWETRRQKYGQRGHSGTYSRFRCHKCVGSSFDDFLEKEGIKEEVHRYARKLAKEKERP